MSELERRRLEEALEAAQGEARGAQLREEQLQAECERLQGELKQLQETRAQVNDGGRRVLTPGPCSGTCRALWRSRGRWKQRLAIWDFLPEYRAALGMGKKQGVWARLVSDGSISPLGSGLQPVGAGHGLGEESWG